MKRTPEMQKFVDEFTKDAFGRSMSEAQKESVCVTCGDSVTPESFRDALSRKEYGISGMCQKCQDSIFGV